MGYYYVKSGGTATADLGRATSKRTGAWNAATADYYDSIYDVCNGVPTTAPAAGDIIICSHLHAKSHAVSALTLLGTITGLTVVSVSDAAQDTYLRGASESNTNSSDFRLINFSGGKYLLQGIDIASASNLLFSVLSDTLCIANDCIFKITSTSTARRMQMNSDGCIVKLSDCILDFANAAQKIRSYRGAFFELDNISLVGTPLDSLVDVLSTSGSTIIIRNSNLSGLASSGSPVVSGADSVSADKVEMHFDRVLIPSGKDLIASDLQLKSLIASATSLDFGNTAAHDHQNFRHHFYAGEVDRDVAVYRDLGSIFGVVNFSINLNSNANASQTTPLEFQLFNQLIDTADFTGSITFTVHFAVDGETTTLDDNEFWMQITYPDGANNALGARAETRGRIPETPLNPNTETGLWTIGATNKQMSIAKSLTIGALAGNIASGVVSVKVFLAKSSQSVFVCAKVEIT